MNQYRIIETYTSFNENTIESVKTITGTSLEDVARRIRDQVHQAFLDECDDEESRAQTLEHLADFYSHISLDTHSRVAGVCMGNEHVTMIIEDTNGWFSMITDADVQDTWTSDTWTSWERLVMDDVYTSIN